MDKFEKATIPIGMFVLYAGHLLVKDQYERVWGIQIDLRKAITDNPVDVFLYDSIELEGKNNVSNT